MIIVLGHATVDPAAMPALRPRLAAMMAATRAETGCISYSLSIEDEAAGVLSIAERWVDLAALQAHFGRRTWPRSTPPGTASSGPSTSSATTSPAKRHCNGAARGRGVTRGRPRSS